MDVCHVALHFETLDPGQLICLEANHPTGGLYVEASRVVLMGLDVRNFEMLDVRCRFLVFPKREEHETNMKFPTSISSYFFIQISSIRLLHYHRAAHRIGGKWWKTDSTFSHSRFIALASLIPKVMKVKRLLASS